MPKPKPDNIIRHEIVLGRSERELLDTIVTANAANKVMTPLVSLMSDASGMLVFLTILEVLGITDLIPDDLRQTLESGIYDTWEGFEKNVLDPVIAVGGATAEQYQRIKNSRVIRGYYLLKQNLPEWAEFGKL